MEVAVILVEDTMVAVVDGVVAITGGVAVVTDTVGTEGAGTGAAGMEVVGTAEDTGVRGMVAVGMAVVPTGGVTHTRMLTGLIVGEGPQLRPRPRLGLVARSVFEGSADSFCPNGLWFFECVRARTALSRTINRWPACIRFLPIRQPSSTQ